MPDGIRAALAALLADAPGSNGSMVVAGSVPRDRCDVINATIVEDARLSGHLRRSPADVVVVGHMPPDLQRALGEHPPALLVLTSDRDSSWDPRVALPSTLVLGPNATVATGPGRQLACAADLIQLQNLLDAVGRQHVRLGLAPTPPWLVSWLGLPPLSDAPVVGTVASRHLDLSWARWAREHGKPHVLVPLGARAPGLERPDPKELEQTVAAHALERWTGPIFPDARVIALVSRGVSPSSAPPSATALATWTQARRALPMMGALLDMESPTEGLDLHDPTVAFLAQRAILRRRRCERLEGEALPHRTEEDDDREARAHEVLAGAGQFLSDHESKVVLRGYGIEITRQAVATSASGAAHFAETIGLPVVLKAVSPDLRRKQDIGAVCLDLPTAAAVRRAYGTIARNVATHAPTARLDGVLVAEMIGPGIDIHCGGLRLPEGDVALYGRALVGATPLEPAFALAPSSGRDALLLADAILARLPVPALRRESDPDIRRLAELFLRLDRLFHGTGHRLLHVDLNPVRLEQGGQRCVTLDARMVQRPHLEGA